MITIRDYVAVDSVDEVLSLFRTSSLPVRLLAGGTDLLTQVWPDGSQVVRLADISGVGELQGIEQAEEGLRIGAATRLAGIEGSSLLAGAWQILARGAAVVGSPQIRNLATLGGNLCNASPAADTAPPLLVLDAEAGAVSPRGRRRIPLADLFAGPGRTVLAEDELLADLYLPPPIPGAVAVYLKHSPRRAMDLAIVSVAVLLALQGGRLRARIALGAVGPTPLRARKTEQLLAGEGRISESIIHEASRLAAAETTPISDVRGTATYRTQMVQALTARALRQTVAHLL